MGWVTQQSTDEECCLPRLHREVDQAVALVAQLPLVESLVTCEERGPPKLHEQAQDVLVCYASVAKVVADLPGTETPASQEIALAYRDVLVEDVHVGDSSITNSSVWLRNAWVAS